MKLWIALVAFAIAMQLGSGAAVAQQAGTPSFESEARQTLEEADSLFAEPCSDGVRTFRHLSTQESSYRTAGERSVRDQGARMYRERYEASGCGRASRQLAVQVYAGGPLQQPAVMSAPPGETVITVGTMPDLVRGVFTPLLVLRHRDCDPRTRFYFVDTKFVSGQVLESGRAWTERWTYDACGVVSNVDIEFAFDGNGIAMSTSLDAPSR